MFNKEHDVPFKTGAIPSGLALSTHRIPHSLSRFSLRLGRFLVYGCAPDVMHMAFRDILV